MNMFLIIENKLLWVDTSNIILCAPVNYPPSDPNAPLNMVTPNVDWYSFKHGLVDYGTERLIGGRLTVDGLTYSMDSSWEHFVLVHTIKTSD